MTIPEGTMTKKVYGRLTTGRLRLLEAVAEAAMADARIRLSLMGHADKSFAEFLVMFGSSMSDNGRAVLEALAALEAGKKALEAYDG